MRRILAIALGTILVAAGMLGASLTVAASDMGAEAQELDAAGQERSAAHGQMHQMMDAMMGAGASERMHAAMPGSEQMMEQCADAMGDMPHSMNGTPAPQEGQ